MGAAPARSYLKTRSSMTGLERSSKGTVFLQGVKRNRKSNGRLGAGAALPYLKTPSAKQFGHRYRRSNASVGTLIAGRNSCQQEDTVNPLTIGVTWRTKRPISSARLFLSKPYNNTGLICVITCCNRRYMQARASTCLYHTFLLVQA